MKTPKNQATSRNILHIWDNRMRIGKCRLNTLVRFVAANCKERQRLSDRYCNKQTRRNAKVARPNFLTRISYNVCLLMTVVVIRTLYLLGSVRILIRTLLERRSEAIGICVYLIGLVSGACVHIVRMAITPGSQLSVSQAIVENKPMFRLKSDERPHSLLENRIN